MDNSFGGMSDDEFFLGYDVMIPEDDPDSINYDLKESARDYRGSYQRGSCCCIALLPILLLVLVIVIILF